MNVGEYTFNDCRVCINPTFFFEKEISKYVTCSLKVAKVSEDPELWDCGWNLKAGDSGSSCPASIDYGYPSKDHAMSMALFQALDYFTRNATQSNKTGKDCIKLLGLIKSELDNLPEPVDSIEVFNHDTDQFVLPL